MAEHFETEKIYWRAKNYVSFHNYLHKHKLNFLQLILLTFNIGRIFLYILSSVRIKKGKKPEEVFKENENFSFFIVKMPCITYTEKVNKKKFYF